jgi:RNA polymerase sigma-B factor
MMERFREYHRTGDRRIRNEIVVQYRYIADRYALRYGTRGVPVEDLRQTALLAIIRATDRFDPDMGVEFATFASRTVDGELKRWLRDKSWAVRPPRSAQERHLTLRRIDEQLTHQLGRSPNVNELAEAMGETVENVLEAIEAGGARTAGGITRTSDDGSTVMAEDLLSDKEFGFNRVDERLLVGELLDRLPARDREVIRMRFFERMGQDDIAKRIGVSQSYLSRMLRRILLDLRSQLAGDEDVSGDLDA